MDAGEREASSELARAGSESGGSGWSLHTGGWPVGRAAVERERQKTNAWAKLTKFGHHDMSPAVNSLLGVHGLKWVSLHLGEHVRSAPSW